MKYKRVPHIYVVGQTASGKTGLSLKLSKDLDLEILNTDSLMFYRDLNIGTAKPSKMELSLCPHHMVDICEVGEDINASDYVKQASKILESSKKNILCVGGSGFYIDALDKGLLPFPQTDPRLVDEVFAIKDPIQKLEEVDLETFNSISREDLYRVRRALQVYYQTGKPLSVWKKENDLKPFARKIAFYLEKDLLLKRVRLRTEAMFKNDSLIEELKEILKKPKAENWKPLRSLGYKQTRDYLNGHYDSKEDLKEDIVVKTMQLAKRQKTWFKKDHKVKWFDYDYDYKQIRDYVLKLWETEQWRA